MIVAFSTSSPLASVALLSADGQVIAADAEEAPQGSSGACLRILDELFRKTGKGLADAELFLADLGPGSFTGVKVGVTLAKSFGFACGKLVGGADSFDLIDPSSVVVIPSKRGEYFVRNPGEEAIRMNTLPVGPYTGYGSGIEVERRPQAKRFAFLLAKIRPVEPERLVPNYLIEPSISTPKKPYAAPGALG